MGKMDLHPVSVRHSSFVTWKRFSKYFTLFLNGLGMESAKMVVQKSELNLRVAPVGMEPLSRPPAKSATWTKTLVFTYYKSAGRREYCTTSVAVVRGGSLSIIHPSDGPHLLMRTALKCVVELGFSSIDELSMDLPQEHSEKASQNGDGRGSKRVA